MDIEGAEIEAFEGAIRSLPCVHNLPIACYHKRNGTTTGRILQPYFQKMGYTTRIEYRLDPTLYVMKTSD